MQVIADPADRILGRRPFAEHGMHVPIDEAGQYRAARGVEHAGGFLVRAGSSARITPSSTRSACTGAIGAAMSPVKNSPMLRTSVRITGARGSRG